ITSGLAAGIDAAAHRGALAAGGCSVAVAGCGPERVYPERHRALADELAGQGAVVSEFPVGTPPRAPNFPRRNRIISGLSLATLVVEAARRSGSLITAGLAADQGREVFAVPGSIHNPQTRGCHDLIRDGATLVDSVDEVLRELEALSGHEFSRSPPAPVNQSQVLDRAHRRLLEAIGYDPVHCDVIAARSGLTIDQLSSMLLLLELNELIQSAPGGCFVRT
ncbi:MAG TPA: DNA-processing protein DprA, partial [Gammaproteobacteria bacterium]